MNMVTALALAVGVLLAVWVKVAALIGLPFWYVGVIGWACYVAAGGKGNGLKKAIAAGVAGMIWVAVAEVIALTSGHVQLEWVLLGVATFIIVLESRLALLSFIPAGLCGAAVIGAGGPIGIFDLPTNLKLGGAFVIGMIVGFIADSIGGALAKKPG
jgi:Protein of unknown function (DUF1097)